MSEHITSPRIEATFHAINSKITAGKDIHLYQSVTVNKLESSVLSRLKHSLNPVTSASYDSYEADQRSECFPNTRVQVINDIEAWINGDSHKVPIYVLDGVAGIGKSTVAQTIAVRSASAGFLGASFFFSRDEDLRKIARYFFPTIAYQLACYDGQFADCISHSLEQNPDAPTKRLHQQLSLLLLGPLQELLEQRSKPTLIVVDALDECAEENAEELLSLLGQHAHRMKSLRILITMRPESHLRDVLEQDRNHERFRLHEIEDSIVHSDIRFYLQSRLSAEEVRKNFRNLRTSWQPTANDMQMLCGICGTLFIIAATATKFILDRKRSNPEKQLARLLHGVSPSGFAGSRYTNVLDETYIRIIFAAQPDLDESDEEWFRELNKVLGALITLATPLPCDALASLLDMEPNDIEATLSQLHSLVAPYGNEESMTFRIHHKSFPDLITNKERIRQVLSSCNWNARTHPDQDSLLWIDTTSQHLRLAKACFRIMNRDLRWNMADIDEKDWYEDKDDLPHISPKLIPQDLAYATLYWSSHLLSGDGLSKDVELQKYLYEWSSKHILAWMEVLIMLDQVNKIYDVLQNAVESLKPKPENAWTEGPRVRELLSDACRLFHQGCEIMKLSTLHVYWSCLPFVPEKTQLYTAYREQAMLTLALGKSYHWESLLSTLIGHSSGVYSVAFSSNGSRLASGSTDTTVRLWNVTTGAHIGTLRGHSNRVSSVAFSSDNSRLASGSLDNTIRIWNATTGAHIYTLKGHSKMVRSVAFSDGSRLASGSNDRTVRVWDTTAGAHVLTLNGHSGAVRSVAFSSDGSLLASGSGDKTVRLWNTTTGTHISTLNGHSHWVQSVTFSSDGSRLASGSCDKTIRIWNATAGVHIVTLRGHSQEVESVAFSSDGSTLASGSSDKTVRLWNVTTGAHISTLRGHSTMVNSVAFSSNGSRLASGSLDHTVRLWDATIVDSSRLISKDSSSHLWDIKNDLHLSAAGLTGHLELVTSVALSSDSSRVASGSVDKTIRLWDTKTGGTIYNLTGHFDVVYSVVFSSDCSWLASGSGDKTAGIWDVNTGVRTWNLTGHLELVKCVAFSTDGSRLASGSNDNTVRIWDTATGACISTLRGHWRSVCSIAFSGDDSRLASGSDDETVRLWDAKTGALIFALTTDPKPDKLFTFDSVAFMGDNTPLVLGSYSGKVVIWDIQTGLHITAFTAPSHLTIKSAIPLYDDSQLANRIFRRGDTNSFCLLLLVQRDIPPTCGLVIARLLSGENWEVVPICWFPLEVQVQSLSLNNVYSQVVIGCRSGRVMLLDFSPKSTQT